MRKEHKNITLRHDGNLFVIDRLTVVITDAKISVRIRESDFHGNLTEKPAYTEAIRQFLEYEGYLSLRINQR